MNNIVSPLRVSDVSLDAIGVSGYDIAFFACGYEQRSSYLFSKLNNTSIKNPVVLTYTDAADKYCAAANRNDFTTRWPDALVPLSGNDDGAIYDCLRDMSLEGECLRILVDYSSMSRVWYNAILNWVRFTPNMPRVIIDFCYSLGKYESGHNPLHIKNIVTLPGCEGGFKIDRKTVVVFGLGFDNTVVLSVLERLEPDTVYAFYAGPGAQTGDAEKAKSMNKDVLDLHVRSVLQLPISSVSAAMRYLNELIAPDLGSENVILVPLGPKPHVLASLLLCRVYEKDLACIRVSGKRSPEVNVLPTGPVVATRVELLGNRAMKRALGGDNEEKQGLAEL